MAEGKKHQLIKTPGDERGSMIVLAIMVLAIMTVIGILSADTSVTESFIVRNTGIYKQNVNLLDAALMEGLQDLIQIDASDPTNLDPDELATDWINDDETWNFVNWYGLTAQMLNANNSLVPDMIINDNPGSVAILENRGEDDAGGLRMAVVGWGVAPGGSLKMNGPSRKRGRVIGEYFSTDAGGTDNGYGMLRMEIGVERVF